MSTYHLKLDGDKPETKKFEEVKIRLSSKQVKALKTQLGIKNDVSASTMMAAYLNQNLK